MIKFFYLDLFYILQIINNYIFQININNYIFLIILLFIMIIKYSLKKQFKLYNSNNYKLKL